MLDYMVGMLTYLYVHPLMRCKWRITEQVRLHPFRGHKCRLKERRRNPYYLQEKTDGTSHIPWYQV